MNQPVAPHPFDDPRLGAAWKFADKWVARGGYGISQFMEGTGANLRPPLNDQSVYPKTQSGHLMTWIGVGNVVPEPASISTLALGVMSLLARRGRR